MINTTTPKDLAKKIEWIGLRNLTHYEQQFVSQNLVETSRFLPRLLALALWSYHGRIAPENLLTRSSDSSLRHYQEREKAKALVKQIMSDYREEESNR